MNKSDLPWKIVKSRRTLVRISLLDPNGSFVKKVLSPWILSSVLHSPQVFSHHCPGTLNSTHSSLHTGNSYTTCVFSSPSQFPDIWTFNSLINLTLKISFSHSLSVSHPTDFSSKVSLTTTTTTIPDLILVYLPSDSTAPYFLLT